MLRVDDAPFENSRSQKQILRIIIFVDLDFIFHLFPELAIQLGKGNRRPFHICLLTSHKQKIEPQ